MKKNIVLAFNLDVNITSLLPFRMTQQGEMLHWLGENGFEISEKVTTKEVLVRFERDEKTMRFIKRFLEPLCRHALPFSSLKSIPGVRVVNVYG